MAKIRSTDTRPELELRQALRKQGLRPRAYPRLPGRPDIALEDSMIAVFVHGCFWHGCPKHYRAPKSHRSYWSAKLTRNVARDRRVARILRGMGWHVLTAWECAIRADSEKVADRIIRATTRLSISA